MCIRRKRAISGKIGGVAAFAFGAAALTGLVSKKERKIPTTNSERERATDRQTQGKLEDLERR